jgi:hypothetical protein
MGKTHYQNKDSPPSGIGDLSPSLANLFMLFGSIDPKHFKIICHIIWLPNLNYFQIILDEENQII